MNLEFDKPLVFENEVALLRPLTVSDFENLLPPALSDPNLLQYSPAPVSSPSLLKTYIEKAVKERETGTRYPFIVFDKRNGQYAGSTSFLNISNHDERLEIGATWYGKAFQGTGLNKHCKHLLLQYVFEVLGFKRVEFRTDERNLASRRAIEKIGGEFEGTLRSHTLMYDGFRRNTCCYSILKEEWGN